LALHRNRYFTDASGGSKTPRLKRDSVQDAIKQFSDWIKVVNEESSATHRIIHAFAFGDFMNTKGSRVQAADVGVRLEPRKTTNEPGSAKEQKSEQVFLKLLRGRSPTLNVRPFEEWMRKRSHVQLLSVSAG
jgi:hypothetical protein